MSENILSQAIRVLYLGSMTFGMSAAIAQESSVTLHHLDMTGGEYSAEIVIAYSDPEGEISNGSDPPDPNFIDPETDVASETDRSIEIYNFPESEVGNGIDPPL